MQLTPWFTKKIIPQIILNDDGDSWLGFHTANLDFVNSCNECRKATANSFFVLKQDGTVLAAQKKLECALMYMNDETVLVHRELEFIPCLGFNKNQTDFLQEYQKRLNERDDYAKKVWEKYTALHDKHEALLKQLADIDNRNLV